MTVVQIFNSTGNCEGEKREKEKDFRERKRWNYRERKRSILPSPKSKVRKRFGLRNRKDHERERAASLDRTVIRSHPTVTPLLPRVQ